MAPSAHLGSSDPSAPKTTERVREASPRSGELLTAHKREIEGFSKAAAPGVDLTDFLFVCIEAGDRWSGPGALHGQWQPHIAEPDEADRSLLAAIFSRNS
jgi:hypothetical protein